MKADEEDHTLKTWASQLNGAIEVSRKEKEIRLMRLSEGVSRFRKLLRWMQVTAKAYDEPGQQPKGLTVHLDGSGYMEYGVWNSSPGQFRTVEFKSIDELEKLVMEPLERN